MGMFLSKLCVEEISRENWKLHEALEYVRTNGEKIIVPAGFITDFASVPKFIPFAYVIFKDEGRKAAVIHDYYYRVIRKDKHEADRLFLGALRDSPEVAIWKIVLLYWAVSLFGFFSWDKNRRTLAAELNSAINPANRNIR
jgi:hypothetical protein